MKTGNKKGSMVKRFFAYVMAAAVTATSCIPATLQPVYAKDVDDGNPFGGQNIALNKTVSVTDPDGNDIAPDASGLTNGNTGDNWEPVKIKEGIADARTEYPLNITVDLEENYWLDHVKLYWNPVAAAYEYEILVSEDGNTWNSVGAEANGIDKSLGDYTFAPQEARYVRVACKTSSRYATYTMYEIEAYTIGGLNADAAEKQFLALSSNGAVAYASAETETEPLLNINDGNTATRWSSGPIGIDGEGVPETEPYCYIDLGADKTFNEIRLLWEAALASEFTISYAKDAGEVSPGEISGWETLGTYTDAKANEWQTYTYETPVTARYVKVTGNKLAMIYGMSLFEFEVNNAPEPKVEAVYLSQDKDYVFEEVGDSIQLYAQPLPANAEGADTVVWNSTNQQVATVTDGKVTAVGSGTAVIQATSGDVTSSIRVMLVDKLATPVVTAEQTGDGITVSWDAVAGATQYEVYRTVDGQEEQVEAAYTATSYVDSDVAAGSTYSYTVKAVQISGGECTGISNISAATTPVTIALGVTGVSLNKKETTLEIKTGEDVPTEKLTAVISPDKATNKEVTWESSEPAVAVVDKGVVTAVAPGTTTITVTTADGGYTDTCAVTVKKQLSTPALSAEKTAAQEITLTWTADENADTYQILRAAGKNGAFAPVAVAKEAITIADGTAEYVDTIDANEVGNTYRYKVAAVPAASGYYTMGNESNETAPIQIGQANPFGTNVAEGKPATATTSIANCEAAKVTDGGTNKLTDGWWESEKTTAGNTDYEQEVTIDFGQDYEIDHVKIYWNNDVPSSDYEILVGAEAPETSDTVVKHYTERPAADGINCISDCSFDVVTARYLTIRMNKVVQYDCYGIVEVEAYTQGTVEAEDTALTDILLSETQVVLAKGDKYDLYAQKLPCNAAENVTWSSNTDTVATVVNGKVTAVKAGVAKITAAAGSYTKSCTVVVTDELQAPENVSAKLEETLEKSVILSWDANAEATVYDIYRTIDDTTTCIASDVAATTYTDETVLAGNTYSYQVVAKNPAKSSEDAQGIALYKDSEKSIASEVTVPIHVTGLTLNKEETELIMLPGEAAPTEALKVTVAPANATETGADWKSDHEEVARVDENGVVTAVAAGTAVITATTKDAKSEAAPVTCTVTVKEKLAAPEIDAALSTDETKITVTVTAVANADTYTVYRSQNAGGYEKVAELTDTLTYEDTELVKGDSYSYQVVAASDTPEKYIDSEESAATKAIVVPIHVTAIELSQTEAELIMLPQAAESATVALTATVVPENATDKAVTWSSENAEVASVDENGVVTAVGIGTTTITVKSKDNEQITASCEITVRQKLEAPEVKAALSEDEASVLLTWEAVANADEYQILRAEGDGAYVSVGNTNETGYTDNEIEKGKTYQYQVKAVSADAFYVANEGTASILVPIHVEGVTLAQTKAELMTGEELLLNVTVLPENASDKNVTFVSDKPEIAAVDENGKVTAKAVGQATITVTTKDGNKTAECSITVTQVLQAPVVKAVRNNKDITLSWNAVENAAGYDVYKATDGKNFVKAASVTTAAYTDKALAVGSYSYKVVAKGSGFYKDSADSNVAAADITVVKVTGVQLSAAALTINKGRTAVLTAAVAPENADNKAVSYKSSNTKVAVVDANGKITATGKGTAVITVTTADGAKTASCKVTVKVPATKVKLNTKKLYLVKGKSVAISKILKASLTPSDSTDKVTWSVPRKSVVTIKGGKLAAGKKTGKVTLTAKTASGKKATCTVYVVSKAKKATSIKMSKKSAALKAGNTITLKATVKPAATTDTVTWTSSNKKIASVDAFGTVTAKKKGKVTITAKTSSGKKATCKITVK